MFCFKSTIMACKYCKKPKNLNECIKAHLHDLKKLNTL